MDETTTNGFLIEVTIAGFTFDPVNRSPILILKDSSGSKMIPIWIGVVEALAIANELEKDRVVSARPMTHDLFCDCLAELGTTIDRVEIVDLKENTYYATLHLVSRTGMHLVDARPSDAIALALRTGAKIHISSQVMEKSQRIDMTAQPVISSDLDRWTDLLDSLAPEDFGKYKM